MDTPLTTNEKYLQSVLNEIERLKQKGVHTLYRINDKIADETAIYVKNYIQKQQGYQIEIKKCMSCKKTWDIIIFF